MFFRKWRGIPAQLAAIVANQIIINKEIRSMRESTQHLMSAVSALAAAVQKSTAEIAEYVELLKAAHDAGDDDAVNEAAAKIKALTSSLNEAVDVSNSAVQQTPSDQAPATGPVADPAIDPASPQPQA